LEFLNNYTFQAPANSVNYVTSFPNYITLFKLKHSILVTINLRIIAMKNKLILAASVLIVCTISLAFTINQQTKPWSVPEKNAKMANPVKSNGESISAGKALWNEHCSSCHGKKGLGDGSKAAQLKTQPQDLSTRALQSQSDGSLYYKISEGRDDMPSFKKKIPDPEDMWSIVNYIRTLKK